MNDISSLIPSNLRVSTLQLKHKLYGHLGKITCIDLNDDEDLIASGSSDKAITLYSLRKGKYLRKIRFKDAPEIVKISPQGYLVTVCSSVNLFVHTFNGKLLQQTDIGYTSDLKITKNGQLLVQANGKAVTIRKLEDLRVVQKFEGMTTTVRCVALSNDDRFAFAGLENGEFIIMPLELPWPRV